MTKVYKLHKVLVFLLLIFISTFSYTQEKKFDAAIIAFYNVENLYDTIDDPKTNDAEFLPQGDNKWNTYKYRQKLARLAEAISRIGEDEVKGGPVVIGLSEIENREVLEDLAKMPALQAGKYGIVHHHSPDRRGVDVALMYQKNRFIPKGNKAYRLTTSDSSFRTRDQFLIWGELDGEEFYFLVNHWPSRRGGETQSAPNRIAAAKLAKRIADSLIKLKPDIKLVIMGDLNDNPDDQSVKTTLNAKSKISELKPGDLFNPMYKLYTDGIGSYAYKDSWDLFDQIIVSYSLTGNDFSSYRLHQAKVFNSQFLKQKTGTFAGYPWRTFAGGKYLAGYSDHFPVYIIVKRYSRQ